MDIADPLEMQLTLADTLETKEQWEQAYKNYLECAVKAKN
jgi:hypothetical protein